MVSVERNKPVEIFVVEGNDGQPSIQPLENSGYIVNGHIQDNTLRYYHGLDYVQEWLLRTGKNTDLMYVNGEFRIYKATTRTQTIGLTFEWHTP